MKLADREEAARLADLPLDATVALADVAGAIKEGLLALSCAAGLLVVQQLMEEEVTEKVGPRGKHDPTRAATRNGSVSGSVVLGGRTVPLRRPRAVRTDGGEVRLDSWSLFSSRDLLSQLAVERMLAGVATRRHGLVNEPVGAELEAKARSTSKSSISRRFKAATETALAEMLARDLSEVDVAVLMIDGIVFAECSGAARRKRRPRPARGRPSGPELHSSPAPRGPRIASPLPPACGPPSLFGFCSACARSVFNLNPS